MNVRIVLAWIPGHQEIALNETADCLAKEMARDIYTGRVSASRVVTYNDSVKIAADIARKSWQTKWNQDVSGFYTRQLIPEVGTKVCFLRREILEYHIVACCCMILCCVMTLIELVRLIHLCVNVVWKENLWNTFYCIATDFKKLEIG